MVEVKLSKIDARQGFTLVELLIASAIGVLMLSVFVTYWTNTVKITAMAVSSRTALEDLRSTGNYMSDMVNQAAYVFPPLSKVTLANSGSAYTVKNPNDGTAVWTIGTDPIVAMFIPPLDLTVACTPGGGQLFSVTKGCIKFMAFYAVKRSDVMNTSTGATGAERPNEDSRVPNAWTIYQYILNIVPPVVVSKPDTVQNLLDSLKTSGALNNYSAAGTSGNLLADYIAPNSFSLSEFECYIDATNIASSTCPSTAPLAIKSTRAVSISFQGQIPRDAGGGLMFVPGNPLLYRATPRNLRDPL